MVRTIQQMRARWYFLSFRQPVSVLLPHQSLEVALKSLSGAVGPTVSLTGVFRDSGFAPCRLGGQINHHRFTLYIQPRLLAQEASLELLGIMCWNFFRSASAAGIWESVRSVLKGLR